MWFNYGYWVKNYKFARFMRYDISFAYRPPQVKVVPMMTRGICTGSGGTGGGTEEITEDQEYGDSDFD